MVAARQRDIFISYARADEAFVQHLANALTEDGWSIWTDQIGIRDGDHFDRQIEEAIASCSLVLVIWSASSVTSQWVRAEASYALGKKKLLPLVIDQASVPLQFIHVQTFSFHDWNFDKTSSDYLRLCDSISRLITNPLLPHNIDIRPERTKEVASHSRGYALRTLFDLRFDDRKKEARFEIFLEKNYWQGQFAIALCNAAWLLGSFAGLVDREHYSMLRSVVGLLPFVPLMLSFTPYARKHFQMFFFICGVLGSFVLLLADLLNSQAPWYHPYFNAISFIIYICFGVLLPLTFLWLIYLGLFVFFMGSACVVFTPIPVPIIIVEVGFLGLVLLSCLCAAYNKEVIMRELFVRTTR